MKKILFSLMIILNLSICVSAENRVPSEITAVSNSENALLAWRNPDCEMAYIKLFGVKEKEKTLICEDFDLSKSALNEYEFLLEDYDEYIINFRSGDGTDRYYTVNEFKNVQNPDNSIRGWEAEYKELTGVNIGLDRADKKSGLSSLHIISNTLKYDTAKISQCVCDIIDVNSDYRLGFWIKSSSAESVRINLSYNSKSEVLTFVPDVSDSVGEWKYIEYVFSGKYAGYVSIGASTCTHEIHIDDMTLYKQKNGENSGVNLLSNSAFEIADNIVNNEVSDFTGSAERNKVYLSWTVPTGYDNEKIRIYNGERLLSEVSAAALGTEIDYREALSDTYKAVVVDNKGNESQGVSITLPPVKGSVYYRQYFDSEAAVDDFTRVSYNSGYKVSDGVFAISRAQGITLLPAESVSDFVFEADIEPDTAKNTRNLGIVFGYDDEASQYGAVFFNGATMSIGKSDVSHIGTFTETIDSITLESDILPLGKMSRVKIIQNDDIFMVSVDGEIIYNGKSTGLTGKFGFLTVTFLGIKADNIEIKAPEIKDFALYDDDYKTTGETGFSNVLRPASNLTIDGNSLYYRENGGNSLWVLESKEELADFVYDFDYTFNAYKYSSSGYAGIAFGYDDETGEYYRIGLRNEGKLFISKMRVEPDEGITTYKEYELDFETGKTYRMRVSVKGENLTLYRDGELILNVNVTGYTGGELGLISNGGGAYFKNILITPYHDEEMEMGNESYSKTFVGENILGEDIVKLSGNVEIAKSESGMEITSEENAVYAIENLLSKENFSYTAEFALSKENQNSGFGLIFRSKYDYGYYKILLNADGGISFARCDDDFTVSDGVVLASVSTGLDFSEPVKLKIIGVDENLYVYINQKLYLTGVMKNEVGGFGFEVSSASLNSLAVNDVSNGDYAAIDGYYAVIEDISVDGKNVGCVVNAGLDIENAYLVGAVYENNSLKDVKIIKDVNAASGSAESFSLDFDEEIGEREVKIMLFEDLSGIKPMAKALKK